jgi:predicted nuclease of restriction endonuclease-like (RecB) superfamily
MPPPKAGVCELLPYFLIYFSVVSAKLDRNFLKDASMTNASVKDSEIIAAGYAELLDTLKAKIRSSQVKASVSVNTELIKLYWEIGLEIAQRQNDEGWGTKVIERLAKDLKRTFPQMAGFSPRNLFYMKQFAEAYPELAILQQAAAKIPWGHNMLLIDKLDELNKRLWYAQKTIENGWSRNALEMWIESDLYCRQGKAITNFSATLPQPVKRHQKVTHRRH